MRPSPIALVRSEEVPNSTREVRRGRVTRVTLGIYAPAAEWSALAPWDRYLARVHAAVIRHPYAVLALESAAAIHGLPIFGDPRTVHVRSSDSARSRLSGGVQVHTTSESNEIAMVGSVAATTQTDTVVDIARSRHPALALAVADAALRAEKTTHELLVATNESRRSSRGRRRARWVLDRASPAPESALESVDRAVIEWLGFPEPELQVAFGSDRVDKWWAPWRVAGEGDGDIKYDGRFGDASDLLRRRHARDARLISSGANAVPHWGWPEVIAFEPLAAILRSAGLPTVAPRTTEPLFSLRQALNPTPLTRENPSA